MRRITRRKYPEKPSRISDHASADGGTNSEPPVFSLCHVDRDYCLSRCSRDEKVGFADSILRLSRLTWLQIMSAGRHQLGSEKIERKAIRVCMPAHLTDDVQLLALRFHELKPMVGYRSGAVFHILWFDRDMNLYDHGD